MAKKKLTIKPKTKLPKAGNGLNTPIKGTKEQYQAYQDSLDLYKQSLQVKPNYFKVPKIDEAEYHRLVKKSVTIPEWEFDEEGYKKDKKAGKSINFKDYMYDVHSDSVKDSVAFENNIGRHYQDANASDTLKDGRIKTYQYMVDGKVEKEDYDIYDPKTGTTRTIMNKELMGISSNKIKPIRTDYYGKDTLIPASKTTLSSTGWHDAKAEAAFKKTDEFQNYFIPATSNDIYQKPVQPIIYKPENKITDKQGYSPNKKYLQQHPVIYVDNPNDPSIGMYTEEGNLISYKPRERPKQQSINIQSAKPDLLQGTNNLEFNPIPYKKGSYFTTNDDEQERDAQGKKGVRYWDKKTGRQLKKFGGQIQNQLDMAKNGKKIKMKLKKADVGKYVNEDPTFNVGDQGYNENIQIQGNQLGQMLNVEPSVFNPSLTYNLEQYNNKKGVKSNPYLNPQEQNQYSQYKDNQKNQFNPSSFIPTQGLFNNFYLNKADRYRKQAINSFSNIGQAEYGKSIPKAQFGYNNGMNLGSGISNAVLADINTAKGYTDIFGSLKMNSQIAQIEAQNKRQNLISQFENPTPTFQNGWGGNNPLDNGYIPVGEYGMSVKAIGGKGQPNIEVENLEHIQLPNGFSEEIQGDSHAQGGIPLNLPQDSKVFSEKLKHPEMKKSYAKLAKKFETKKDFKQLENPISSKLNKSTAELNIKLKNEGLDELFMEQEMNKIEGLHGKDAQKSTMRDYEMKNGGSVLPETAATGKLVGKKARIKAFQEAMLNQQNNTNQPQGDEQYYGQNTINPAVSQTTNVQQPVNTIQNNAPIVNSIPPSLFKTFDTKFNKKTMDTGYDVTTDPPTESDWQNTIIPSWYNYEEGNLPYLTNSSNQKFSDKIPKNLQTNEALLQEVEYDSILDRLDPKQNYTKEERDAALLQMKNIWGKIGRVSFNNGKNYKKPNVNSWKSGDEATYKELAELRGNFIDSKLEKRYFTPISNPQKPPSKTQPAVQQSSIPGTIPSLQAEKLNRLKGFNSNITALQLPDAYVKDPITVNNLQPEFYQPNTITPYLNDIQRLQYATNTNLGTSGADLASRANSFGQGLTEYYKRLHDASTYNAGVKTQASKDNALTKLNTNQFNNSNYINNARNPQLQREAVITEQKRMDREAQLKTFADKEHEQNVNNYLQNIYDPNYALNANFSNPYGLKSANAESEEAKKAKAYETLYGKKKYGGKLKLKPKKKK